MEVKHRAAPSSPDSTSASVENVDPIELDNANTLVIVAFSDDCPEETKEWLQRMFSEPGKTWSLSLFLCVTVHKFLDWS
jgi:hypothetical protein